MNRDIKKSMFDYLPRYYEEVKEVEAIIGTESNQLTELRQNSHDVLAQLFIDTATWSLPEWERFVGLKNTGDYVNTTFQSLEENGVDFETISNSVWYEFEKMYPPNPTPARQNIKAKIRGFGTVTPLLIKNVAESYSNGTVEVVEDTANYVVKIRFVGEYGIPSKMDDVKAIIREIMPAHLAIEYLFKYVTYAEVDAKYASYTNLEATGFTYEQILTNGE